MPSRTSSTKKVRRAKSSASVITRSVAAELGHVDPIVAHQHALTAAAAAYERATGSGDARDGSAVTDAKKRETNVLRKTESVRFAGPNAVPGQQKSITRRYAKGTQDMHNKSQGRSRDSKEKATSHEAQETVVTALPQLGFLKTTSASYKKLRKARSMFTPRKSPGTATDRGTPEPRGPGTEGFRRFSMVGESLPGPSMTSKRSTSILRGFMDTGFRPYQENYDQDAAIQLARDQYLRQLEEQRSKEQPLLFKLSNNRAAEKKFRRTVRSSSSNSYGNAIASTQSQSFVGTDTLGDKARTLSLTFKERFKKVFHRNTSSQLSLPAQQIDSERRHFGRSMTVTSVNAERGPTTPTPNGRLPSPLIGRGSSIDRLPEYFDKDLRPGSARNASTASPTPVRSRVSSWTNSTANNTMTKQQLLAKKKLSIIQENGGPHQPSVSTGVLGAAARRGYAAFRKPLRGTTSSGRLRGPVDSQRIFSALQKRLDQHNQQYETADTDLGQFVGSEQTRKTSKTSSRNASVHTQRTVSTTVRLLSKESQNEPSGNHSIRMSKSANFTSAPSHDAVDVFTSSRSSVAGHQAEAVSPDLLEGGLTYQQIAERNERNERGSKQPLREVKSTFFPAKAGYQSKSMSPYRRALHPSTEANGRMKKSDSSTAKGSGQTPSRSGNLQVPGSASAVSDSAYSRRTDETSQAYETALSAAPVDSRAEAGTAYIFNDDTQPFHSANRPALRRLPSSTESLGDWKGWMASEVASLENLGTPDQTALNLRSTGRTTSTKHRRENAQINGDDSQVVARRHSNILPKQPLANLQINAASRPLLQHKTSHQMFEKFPLRFPLIERRPSPGANSVKEKSSTLSTETERGGKKPLESENIRPSASQPHLKSGPNNPKLTAPQFVNRSLEIHNEHSTGQAKRSDSTNPAELRDPGKVNTISPAQAQRISPERVARLRRMHSSNTIGSKQPKTITEPFRDSGLDQQENKENNGLITTSSPPDVLGIRDEDQSQTAPNYKRFGTSQGMVESFLGSRRDGRIVTNGLGPNSSPVFI